LTDGREELVRHRMERAGECLDDARILLENGKYRGAVNRGYYVAFYAANFYDPALCQSRQLANTNKNPMIS